MFDSEIFQITLLSLQVSAIATLISLLIGLPFGTWLALGNFRGQVISVEHCQHGHGLAACCGGPRCGNDFMAQRSAWRI